MVVVVGGHGACTGLLLSHDFMNSPGREGDGESGHGVDVVLEYENGERL